MPAKRTRAVVSEAETTSIIGLSIQTVKGDRPLFEKVNLRSNGSKGSLLAGSGTFPPAPLVEMSDSFMPTSVVYNDGRI